MDGIIALALAKKYADQVGQQVISAGFKVQVEQDRSILNGQGQEKILYLLPKASGSTGDGYDEFVYAQNSWEWIGKTDIDLSGYALKTEVGDLDNLPTTDKSSLVAAVSETFTNVSDGKALVASAITDKGVQTSSDATFATMAQNIEDIPTGGGVESQKVNFYDFKGNLAHSYTAAEAAELTEMPEAPTIEGFTFQKWNWSLESVKTWLTKHGNDNCELNVGGLYVTTDGHTRIYMHLREAELASLEMPFCIQQMAGTVVIDWGDDSTPETITAAGIYSHLWQVNQYPADVVIDIEYIPSGSTKLVLGRAVGSTTYGLFNNERYYASCVEKVEYGNNNAFPSGYSGTFKNCKHLKTINIPFGISVIGIATFLNCTNLTLIALPDGLTNISSTAFSGCKNLALTVLPDGVTRISDTVFSGCTNLALTVLPDGLTSIDAYSFQDCTNLALIALPDGLTSIDAYAFLNCTNLTLIALPDGLTSINTTAFSGCTNLALIALPNGLTNIGSNAFSGCTSLYIIDLTAFTDPQSIPTLNNANAFQGIPAQAQFWVKNQEMYDVFTTATNWSSYAGKFVIKGA